MDSLFQANSDLDLISKEKLNPIVHRGNTNLHIHNTTVGAT